MERHRAAIRLGGFSSGAQLAVPDQLLLVASAYVRLESRRSPEEYPSPETKKRAEARFV